MTGVLLEHRSKQLRKLCQACLERKARYQYRGRVRADRQHTLCFACYRAERDRQRLTLWTPRTVSDPHTAGDIDSEAQPSEDYASSPTPPAHFSARRSAGL